MLDLNIAPHDALVEDARVQLRFLTKERNFSRGQVIRLHRRELAEICLSVYLLVDLLKIQAITFLRDAGIPTHDRSANSEAASGGPGEVPGE